MRLGIAPVFAGCALVLFGCKGSSEGFDRGQGGDGNSGGEDSGGGVYNSGGNDTGGSGGVGGSGASTASGGTLADGGVPPGNDGGPGGTPGLRLPYTLTPIGQPQANTANVALYFTVTDADDEPVPGLATDDFQATEDGSALDIFESAFRAEKAGSVLMVPTVLVLDLSRSVVQAGALDQVKAAAHQVIENLGPAQRLAIVTFADEVNTRSCFDSSVQQHRDAIDAISKEDGISTNLYGTLQQAYNMFDDGFYSPNVSGCEIYSGGGGEPNLVAGLVIVVSDGNDTAARAMLTDAVNARDDRRTLFIRVGQDLDANVAATLGNAGVIDAAGGFDDLEAAVTEAIARTNRLNDAIYIAEYCSPKRAGSHELVFTVPGNQPYLDGDVSQSSRCAPTGYGMGDPGEAICTFVTSTQYRYCDAASPYWCEALGQCYVSESGAFADCGSSCRICGVADEEPVGSAESGLAITVNFSANGFSDAQCDRLFNPPEPPMPGPDGGPPPSSLDPRYCGEYQGDECDACLQSQCCGEYEGCFNGEDVCQTDRGFEQVRACLRQQPFVDEETLLSCVEAPPYSAALEQLATCAFGSDCQSVCFGGFL